MTEGRSSRNIIGFEGSGLTSGKYIRITTEWFDRDGTPLPGELPGFTGRLAKIVAGGNLATVGGQMANFEINPGLHTHMVMLPQERIDDAHYYIHVNGEPPEGNPNFEEIGAAENGPLQYRPSHYVPFKVSFFDGQATLAAALKSGWETGDPIPVLDNIEKVYQWHYRPEMQFSLFDFDFDIDELEMLTTINDDTGESDTSLTFNYDLYQDPAYDPLDPLGPERELIFGLGYAEIEALLGQDQQGQFTSLEDLLAMNPVEQYQQVSVMLNNLRVEDFMGLQLYQNSDAGNQLAELYGVRGNNKGRTSDYKLPINATVDA